MNFAALNERNTPVTKTKESHGLGPLIGTGLACNLSNW
jgi:hypothetical protein